LPGRRLVRRAACVVALARGARGALAQPQGDTRVLHRFLGLLSPGAACYIWGMTSAAPGSVSSRAPAVPWLEELDILVRARYPMLYLVSWEEHRVDAILSEL